MPEREAPSDDGASSYLHLKRVVRGSARAGGGLAGTRGLWRVTVADGSMLPSIAPGDWLLVDPTTARWPRRGSVVVFREPDSGVLAIKRVVARPGDWTRFGDGWLQMSEDEAWLLGDATDDELAAAGHGPAIDSRRYGPVPVEALVGRAWFRYGPVRRIGRLRSA
jgi:signal peptidase I